MNEQIRLGDLLTRAGLLRPEDLREGMLIAKQQSLPVGRVLIMAEFISEPNLQAAVQAQSMLKDGVIDLDTALSALQISARGNLSLDEALNQCGWKDKTNSATNKLGGLITEAGLISKEQLEQGLHQCQMSGLPLGRVLVAMGFMSESTLAAALNAQILIRDSKIQRELAIQGLRACHERQISIEQSLRDAGLLQMPVQDTVRLGELFVMASLLDQDNLMQAVELGLTESKPIGQVLVEHQMITEASLEAALQVQRAVTEGRIKKDQCGEVLASMATKALTLEEAITKLEPPKQANVPGLPLYQFLQLAGLITAKDIEEALKQGSRDTELMGRMLLLTGAIDSTSLTSAVRLNDMVSNNILKAEQAILAMGLCQNRNCSVEQAFKSLGWGMALDQAYREQETIPPSQALSASALEAQRSAGQAAQMQPGQSGSYPAATPQPDATPSGQHPAVGQQGGPALQSGQHQAVGQAAQSGQYQALGQQGMQSGQHPAAGQTGQHDAFGHTGQHQAVDHAASGQYQQLGSGQTGQHEAFGQTGQHDAFGQTGQHDAFGQTGQHQAMGQTGQHDAFGQTGQHQAVDHAASGQYQQLGSGQYPAVQQPNPNAYDQSAQYQQGSGQYPAAQQPDPNAQNTGQHAAFNQSGQYNALQQQQTSGERHQAILPMDASQTATSDVPVISADSFLLQQPPVPTAFDEPPPSAADAAPEAADEGGEDEQEDDGSGKKKKGKGGGGGKKRLADLMP